MTEPNSPETATNVQETATAARREALLQLAAKAGVAAPLMVALLTPGESRAQDSTGDSGSLGGCDPLNNPGACV